MAPQKNIPNIAVEMVSRLTCVDGGFSSSDRHVGGVGYQCCTFHDRFGDPINFNCEFREISQYLENRYDR